MSGTREREKRIAAEAALAELVPGAPLGVGTGSTVDCFIDLLGSVRERIDGAVPSSRRSARRLERVGVRLLDLPQVGRLPLYVDGADESDRRLRLIKGGGGALTREKIVAAASERFVCIADASKLVETLGAFPLPLEVIPLATGHVTACLNALGGRPGLREGFTTDNGNRILDVAGLSFADPLQLEDRLDRIAGVVAHGLFARRPADLLLLGTDSGVRRLEP